MGDTNFPFNIENPGIYHLFPYYGLMEFPEFESRYYGSMVHFNSEDEPVAK